MAIIGVRSEVKEGSITGITSGLLNWMNNGFTSNEHNKIAVGNATLFLGKALRADGDRTAKRAQVSASLSRQRP
ncbi:MAG: hypothetical protein DRQ42_07120 [Gammaproteobacteria bacterium]|nr:MAG: hypothetical protein DRQ42_07120 [Gammaproteobacteria bacterium]